MLPVFAFLSLKVPVAIDLHFMNHVRIMVSAKNHLYCSTEEKNVILYGMYGFWLACWHHLVLVKVNVPPVFSVSFLSVCPLGFQYTFTETEHQTSHAGVLTFLQCL